MKHLVAAACLAPLIAVSAFAQCPAGVDPTASRPLSQETASSNCSTKKSHGFPVPDARCTPGSINPTITTAILTGGHFKTSCERDQASSAHQKATTYSEYNISHPSNNTGSTQTCELDHLVSLELGGADTLDNIWPQCGPKNTLLAKRFFKKKDRVENYLAAQVRAGNMTLEEAQDGIVADWTQYIDRSVAFFKTHSIRGFGSDQ